VSPADIEDRDRLTLLERVALTGATLAGVAVAGVLVLVALEVVWTFFGLFASLGEALGFE
jgi:hypothetical protein